MIPWGRFLCGPCLTAEIDRQSVEDGRPQPDPGPPARVECRSCYAPVDQRALVCPHCGQDPHTDFWDANGTREPSHEGPWIAAAFLLLILPLASFLMFALF